MNRMMYTCKATTHRVCSSMDREDSATRAKSLRVICLIGISTLGRDLIKLIGALPIQILRIKRAELIVTILVIRTIEIQWLSDQWKTKTCNFQIKGLGCRIQFFMKLTLLSCASVEKVLVGQ